VASRVFDVVVAPQSVRISEADFPSVLRRNVGFSSRYAANGGKAEAESRGTRDAKDRAS
jgi:hypothetical protein